MENNLSHGINIIPFELKNYAIINNGCTKRNYFFFMDQWSYHIKNLGLKQKTAPPKPARMQFLLINFANE